MPDLNPLKPGDVPYPQYSVVTTVSLEAGDTYVKGRLYTISTATGLLHVGGAPNDFVTGVFQAMADVTLPAVAGDKLQVIGPRTRMLLTTTEVGLSVGDDVVGTLDTDVVISGGKSDTDYLGKVFEIYTKDTDGNKKLLTAANDVVIVETVQA